jgi:ADP-ribose pyrophosphatase
MNPADDPEYEHLRLAETCETRERLIEGRFLKAWRDTVRLPDGRQASREYIEHPGAVVIMALLEGEGGQTRIVLERQFRYPVGQVMTELPAGKLDPGEDPLHCAQRELLEETGYTARQWARAGQMHLAIAYSTEVIHIFFARDLQAGTRQLDEGEFLDVFTATPVQAMAWCQQGLITDAKTLSCMVWLHNVLEGRWALNWQTPAPISRP